MDQPATQTITAGGAIFARLKALGIAHVFCNSGTDFPPIIEGLAEAAAQDTPLPQAITVPHEHVAMGMAHGAWLATGETQAVMLHTNVGLANGVIGAINAHCDQVPVILMSGRTPTTEQGRFGSRTVPIGWGQEMRDQTAMVRECTKFDYELRFPEQIAGLLDRAAAIAQSEPKGPVYLSLPREVLCQPVTADLAAPSATVPAAHAPRPEDIALLAEWISRAKRPILIAQRGAGSQAAFETLSSLVADWAIPVCHWWANAIAIPTTHPMEVGQDPGPWLADADLVIVLNSLAPWMPDAHTLAPDARVVQIGPDPLFSRTPVRMFPAQLAIAADPAQVIARLQAELAGYRPRGVNTRRARIVEAHEDMHARAILAAEQGNGAPMSKAWISLCLSQAIQRAGRRATVLSELGCPMAPMQLDHAQAWRQEPHSGGLGWSLPAALGMQLADPNRLIFATMGDGSYMFANPVAAHQVAEAHGLPVIALILNNSEWGGGAPLGDGDVP